MKNILFNKINRIKSPYNEEIKQNTICAIYYLVEQIEEEFVIEERGIGQYIKTIW